MRETKTERIKLSNLIFIPLMLITRLKCFFEVSFQFTYLLVKPQNYADSTFLHGFVGCAQRSEFQRKSILK